MLGNLIYLYASVIPLMFLLVGLLIKSPKSVKGEKMINQYSIKEGENLVISLKIKVAHGLGPVIIHDPIPSNFELVEGNNFRVFWKGVGTKEIEYSYTVKCPKRGDYEIRPTEWTSEHIFKMRASKQGLFSDEKEITVHPSSSIFEEIKHRHIGKLPTPKEDFSKLGVRTTDFKEIREYDYGDPLSIINWKATAKRGKRSRPLVNEYEHEGKKTVWIFLDADFDLRLGNTVYNLFEAGVKAANDTTKFFTDRRYIVGMCIYNSKEESLYPETGKKQYENIREKLTRIDCTDEIVKEGFENAVIDCASFLKRYKPLPVIITSLSKERRSFRKGCKLLKKILTGGEKEQLPIVVVNVLPYSLNPTANSTYKRNATIFDSIEQKSVKDFISRSGGIVIDWDPEKEDFKKAFSREVYIYET